MKGWRHKIGVGRAMRISKGCLLPLLAAFLLTTAATLLTISSCSSTATTPSPSADLVLPALQAQRPERPVLSEEPTAEALLGNLDKLMAYGDLMGSYATALEDCIETLKKFGEGGGQ